MITQAWSNRLRREWARNVCVGPNLQFIKFACLTMTQSKMIGPELFSTGRHWKSLLKQNFLLNKFSNVIINFRKQRNMSQTEQLFLWSHSSNKKVVILQNLIQSQFCIFTTSLEWKNYCFESSKIFCIKVGHFNIVGACEK